LTDSLPKLLLRRSAAGPAAILAGRDARPFFGSAFDRLLARRVLAELAPTTSWPPCSTCSCLYGERLIVEIDGALIAECPDDAAASDALDPSDLRSFAIDTDRLVAVLASGSGWPDVPECLGAQVWRLGDLPDSRTVILILDAAAFRVPSLPSILRAAPAPSSVTFLVPPGVAPDTRRSFLDMRYHLVDLLDAMHPTELRLDQKKLAPGANPSGSMAAAGMLLSINALGPRPASMARRCGCGRATSTCWRYSPARQRMAARWQDRTICSAPWPVERIGPTRSPASNWTNRSAASAGHCAPRAGCQGPRARR
jgi:hypothetical protein